MNVWSRIFMFQLVVFKCNMKYEMFLSGEIKYMQTVICKAYDEKYHFSEHRYIIIMFRDSQGTALLPVFSQGMHKQKLNLSFDFYE